MSLDNIVYLLMLCLGSGPETGGIYTRASNREVCTEAVEAATTNPITNYYVEFYNLHYTLRNFYNE